MREESERRVRGEERGGGGSVVLLYFTACSRPGPYLTDLISESECTENRSVTESESRHILFTLTEP